MIDSAPCSITSMAAIEKPAINQFSTVEPVAVAQVFKGYGEDSSKDEDNEYKDSGRLDGYPESMNSEDKNMLH